MKIKLERMWINESINRGNELRVDWSNDRHHAVVIKHPGGSYEVAEAFRDMAMLIFQDPYLREPPQAKEMR